MTDERRNTKQTKSELISVTVFAIFFGMYVLNILVGKAKIVFGWEVFHLGSVGEFLMLLTACVAFVVAALQAETALKNRKQKQE